MSIAPFPHRYSIELGTDGTLRAPPRSVIHVGAPPQFGGEDTVWSPEELLVGAVAACLRTTFDAYARRKALVVTSFSARGIGTLAKTANGPEFTSLELIVDVGVPAGEEERAKELLLRAERDCIISRALKTQVTLTFSVTAQSNEARVPAEIT